MVTFTVTVQEPAAGMEPPVKVTLEAPTVAVAPQVLLALPDASMPLGNVSVSGALSAAAVLLVLLKVMVRVETPPEIMVAGLKALPTVTGEGTETFKVAMAGIALLPLLVSKAPAASELM